MVTDEAELAPLEEHLLVCHFCMERAEKIADDVDTLRRVLAERNEKPRK